MKFYKEENKWYVDMPGFKGSKEELQMVSGADSLLDSLSDYSDNIDIDVSLNFKIGYLHLKFLEEDFIVGGAYYWNNDLKISVWLCEVLRWYFGELPKNIYFKKIK